MDGRANLAGTWQQPARTPIVWPQSWTPRPAAQRTRPLPAGNLTPGSRRPAAPVWLISIPKPPRRSRIPRPPMPRLPLSVLQRLCGGRSLFFICLMLLRLGMVTQEAVRKTHDAHQAIVGGTIFVLAVLIASPDRRVRAPAIGLFTALFWTYALAGSLETPTLTMWPALLVIGFLAATIENLYSHTARRIERRQQREQTSGIEALRRRAVLLQLANVALALAPVAYVLVLDAELYGIMGHSLLELIPLAISLPPLVGSAIHAIYATRRVVTLHAEPDDA